MEHADRTMTKEEGTVRVGRRMTFRTPLIPAVYALLSYVVICFLINSLDDPDYYTFFFVRQPALFQSRSWFWTASLAGSAVILLSHYFVAFFFPRECGLTFGMLLLALGQFLIAFFSSVYWNHSHFLLYVWPGLLSVAVAWTARIDSGYEPESHWKWEAMSFVLLLLALVAYVPYLLGISHSQFSKDVFIRKNVVVILQGLGLMLFMLVSFRRLSPKQVLSGL